MEKISRRLREMDENVLRNGFQGAKRFPDGGRPLVCWEVPVDPQYIPDNWAKAVEEWSNCVIIIVDATGISIYAGEEGAYLPINEPEEESREICLRFLDLLASPLRLSLLIELITMLGGQEI
jgi:hypothetical protein